MPKNVSGDFACKWYTNLDVKYRHDWVTLTKSYYENSEVYPTYLNFDAIHVSSVKDIPYDYEGMMGVPSTIMTKFNPEQFDIVGSSIGLAEKPEFDIPKNKRGGPAFYLPDGKGSVKRIFAMLVIRNLHSRKEEV